MGKTNYLENEVLRLSLGKPLVTTLPIDARLVLFTTLPGEDGTGGVEVSGAGYTPVANVGSKYPDPTGAGSVANSADVSFGTAGSDWGTLRGFGIRIGSGGALLRFAALTPNVPVTTGQPVLFPAGSLIFEEL